MDGEAMDKLLARLAAKPETVVTPDGGTALVQFRKDPVLWHAKQEAQRHVFHDPNDLIAYLSGDAIEADVIVGVDGARAGSERIVAMIDPREPNHSTISCPLPYHPVFDAWNQKFRASEFHGQAVLHQLIRFFGEGLVEPTRDVLLGQIGTLSVAEGQDLKVEIDARGMTRFRGGSANTAVDGSIPSDLVLTAYAFEYSDEPATFLIKLSMAVRDGKALFKLDCPTLEMVRRREVAAVVAKVREKLAERSVQVYAAALDTATVAKFA